MNESPKPLIMGILNVTPDSFSDGGQFYVTDRALKHAEQLIEEGADIIDVGGESTRPGADQVAISEEISRVIPVIEGIRKRWDVRLSVDTSKGDVAEAALDAGATLINDISAGADIKMASLAARPGIEIVLMHMRGTPVTMQVQPLYCRGVVEEVKQFLGDRLKAFSEAGVDSSKVWLDPGIGFGKTMNHNLELLRRFNEFQSLGCRLVVGTSRKSFLAACLGNPRLEFEEREPGTIASNLYAYTQGASVFRVHRVGDFKKALRTWEAIQNGR